MWSIVISINDKALLCVQMLSTDQCGEITTIGEEAIYVSLIQRAE